MDDKDLAKLLLAYKANVDATNRSGMTPLHYAASLGHKEVSELLVVNHADINARTGEGLYRGDKMNAWMTPLGEAEKNGQKEMAEWLRQHGGHE
jgi:ankyrin repeat protein